MQHAFKTPSCGTSPSAARYMQHDGSARTLHDAVTHYDSGFIERPSLSPEIRRLNLLAREVDDLVAFMRTLSSTDDLIPAPVLPTEENSSMNHLGTCTWPASPAPCCWPRAPPSRSPPHR